MIKPKAARAQTGRKAFCNNKEVFCMTSENKTLPGICCEVANCVHNNGHCCCTANGITVKNRMAILGEETMCETIEEA